MLKRALPAAAATAVLAFAPSALAATVTSGNPLTVNGQTDTNQDWAFDDSAGGGTVDTYFYADPVAYSDTNPLPANCQDYDSAAADAGTPGPDTTNDPSGDGVAHILRCDNVSSAIANAGDAGSTIDATSGSPEFMTLTHGPGLADTPIEINGGSGADNLFGGSQADNVSGGAGDDWVAGYNGNDTVSGGTGDDGAVGGSGNDSVSSGDGDDYRVAGGPGDDTISSGDGNDDVSGDDGNDTIDAGAGDDFVYGGNGDDVIHGGAGNDGRQGTDFVFLPFAQGGGPSFLGQGLDGGNGNDTIYGDDGIDVILGEYGADTIDGGGQSDYIVEYDDEDGPDFPSNDTVKGGDGVDSLQYWECWNAGAASANLALDSQSNDGLDITDPTWTDDASNNYDVENVDLHDTFFLFPIFGCAGDAPVTLTGDASANVLSGGGGNDAIDGGAGPDRLEGEAGDDTFQTRDGYPDSVSCGDGTDTVVADQFDSLEACENVDVANVRSAYDKDEPPVIPAPVVFPAVTPPVADNSGPTTALTTDTTINSEQLLNGVTLNVTCQNEPCSIEGRLLGSEPVGSKASTSAVRGFNVVLGRKYMGMKQGKQNIKVKPCVRKSAKAAASCRARLRASWARKKSFTVKVQVTATDKAGNRTRKTKLIKVSVKKATKATH